MNVYKKLQYENNLKVKPLLDEFKKEFFFSPYNIIWADQKREEYLKNEIARLSEKSKEILLAFKEWKKENPPEWLLDVSFELSGVMNLIHQIKKYKNLLTMKHNKISPEMIEQCRTYPIENLVKIVRFGSPRFANCPFHIDKDPSFAIYDDNSWHCFGCKITGSNAIDYVMKKDNCTFMQAIVKIKNLETNIK